MRPAAGEDFSLAPPEVSARIMDLFHGYFTATLAENVHAVIALHGAGRHGRIALIVPGNISFVPTPSYSSSTTPSNRSGSTCCERFLRLRLFDDYQAILEACHDAWNALTADTDRVRSLCAYPWITKVAS